MPQKSPSIAVMFFFFLLIVPVILSLQILEIIMSFLRKCFACEFRFIETME